MASIVKWYPKRFTKKFENHMDRNMDTAAEFLQADIQKAFPGCDGAPPRPGEIPTIQTGALKKSIRWSKGVKQFTRKIGSVIKGYPVFLEFGTKRMTKRPYLRPAIDRNKQNLSRIIERPMV